MSATPETTLNSQRRSGLDRLLSVFADVRAGEGATVVLMLINIFLLLVCYSVIKTVREPLILLGGGAEVRSYAAAGQAILLMAFVPLYGWFASRVDRARLLVGVTIFFIACIELFAAAVVARVPYTGVAFFIWVGIFNMSLVAQFWSFASDIYNKEAGDRLFPIIMIGMTAGAPLGSYIAGHLFRTGLAPQVILQVSAVLLAVSIALYLRINSTEERKRTEPQPLLAAGDAFQLVFANRYLRLIAALVVLLNIVNTTGEYLVARLLSAHVSELALADAAFNKQAYIGAFFGDYQFWVNLTALFLQAFATSRLVKHTGLRGALLALPLVALGGYAIVAAGVSFSVVRWVKTAENATDYSIMNTARQLVWLPATREEKYKAKQAIDTFFVRAGDVLSAAVVYFGTTTLHLTVNQFALGNIVLTMIWIGVALMILKPRLMMPRLVLRPLAPAAIVVLLAVLFLGLGSTAAAQDTREDELAAKRAEKAQNLKPFEPNQTERRLEMVDRFLNSTSSIYPFMGSALKGGGFAAGPGYRHSFGDTGTFDAHLAWSIRGYKAAEATLGVPSFASNLVKVDVRTKWLDAPDVPFYGIGNDPTSDARRGFALTRKSVGAAARIHATDILHAGAAFDAIGHETGPVVGDDLFSAVTNYARSSVFAEIDWRSSPLYTRRGGLYRVDWSNYQQTNTGNSSFRRLDAEVRQFVPVLRENWIIALRGLVSTTDTAPGQSVPFFLLPDLGGSDALRGYSAWQFRDRSRLLLSGEYRWTAGSLVDMALFIDAGNVGPRLRDISLKDLEITRGIGVTLHTPNATLTRIELARTSEGMRVAMSMSPSF